MNHPAMAIHHSQVCGPVLLIGIGLGSFWLMLAGLGWTILLVVARGHSCVPPSSKLAWHMPVTGVQEGERNCAKPLET